MNLPDMENHPGLLSLLEKMGARKTPKAFTVKWDFKTMGDLELDNLNDVIFDESTGLLTYQGNPIILYISDIKSSGIFGKDSHRYSRPKYHLSECTTIRQMKKNGRFERYVVTQRDDGCFKMVPEDGTKSFDAELLLCRNCLGDLSRAKNKPFINNYSPEAEKTKVFLKKFFAALLDGGSGSSVTGFSELPTRSDTGKLVPNVYSNDFAVISLKLREKHKFKCEDCGVDLSKTPKFLHTHHINGNKSDNRTGNLKVLCLRCHAEQPMHSHLKNTREYTIFVQGNTP